MIEISYNKGQIRLYIDGPTNPTPFKITRESLEVYRKRISNTYQGDSNENRLCNMQQIQVTTGSR